MHSAIKGALKGIFVVNTAFGFCVTSGRTIAAASDDGSNRKTEIWIDISVEVIVERGASLETTQSEVIASLHPGTFRQVRKRVHVPFIAMSVTTSALRLIERHPRVKSVTRSFDVGPNKP